ncbi:unnamed protein product [Cyclocybe aegerita]|uniref:F-box domain-containing protein n=1 Tax=Cyclocybe aegerita TaxID=1973307 RepID=A0A8S0XIT9_CYCAE|nr:unnamed protein product [Cyclocybe aegerita]
MDQQEPIVHLHRTIAANPRFPQEILDQFIDFSVPDHSADTLGRQTLLSWSTVSLPCNTRARKHLFACIPIEIVDEKHQDALKNIAVLLRGNNRNIRNIPQRLEIETCDCRSLNRWWDRVSEIMDFMPQLQELSIDSVSGINWRGVQGDVRQSIWNLWNKLPSLTTLELESFYNFNADFLLGWRNIRILSLDNCGFSMTPPEETPDFHEVAVSAPPARWDSLHLSHSLNFLTVISQKSLPQLSSITTRFMKFYNTGTDFWKLFASISTLSTEKLELVVPMPHTLFFPDDNFYTPQPGHEAPRLISLHIRDQGFWLFGSSVDFAPIIAFGSAARLRKVNLTFEIRISDDEEPVQGIPEEEDWHGLDLAFSGPSISFPEAH